MFIQVITKENCEIEVLKESKPVLLDFWAAWGSPCKLLAPVLEEIDIEEMISR